VPATDALQVDVVETIIPHHGQVNASTTSMKFIVSQKTLRMKLLRGVFESYELALNSWC